MDSTLIVLNPQEFGIEKTEAEQIQSVFVPMLEKMTELEKEYNIIISQPIEQSLCDKARELRLKLVKVRTGTKEIHKKAKAYYLAGSRLVDAWKNAQEFSAIEKESNLEKIEKHFELIEAEKKEQANQERIKQLSLYVSDVTCYDLKNMTENGFTQLLESSKFAFDARVEAERKVEEERIAKVKAETEAREQMKIENERLRKEAEARELEIKKEREEQEKVLRAERVKAETERKALEEQARKEAEARAILEAEKLEVQRKEEELLAKELEAKKQAELAPDKDKLIKYAVELGCLEVPQLETKEAKATLKKALSLIGQAVELLKIV